MCERILLIEEDLDLRRIIEAALTIVEYKVTAASNGLDGLAFAIQQRCDLIITGKMTHIMDSNQFINELSTKLPDPPPVIMLTSEAYLNEFETDNRLEVTCCEPISIFNLLEVVKSVLRNIGSFYFETL